MKYRIGSKVKFGDIETKIIGRRGTTSFIIELPNGWSVRSGIVNLKLETYGKI